MKFLLAFTLIAFSLAVNARPVVVDLSWQPQEQAEAYQAHCWRHNIDPLPTLTTTQATAIQFNLEGNEGEPVRCRIRATKAGVTPSDFADLTVNIPPAPVIPLQVPEIIEIKVTYAP